MKDYVDYEDRQDLDPYAIEKVARILCGLCAFLALIYSLYAGLVFVMKDEIIPPDFQGSGGDRLLVGESRLGQRGGGGVELGRIGDAVRQHAHNSGPCGAGTAVGSEDDEDNVSGEVRRRSGYEPPLSTPGVGQAQTATDMFLSTRTTESY